MSKPAPLTYRELIKPERSRRKVLLPDKIPIAPDVYNNPACFTEEFVAKVRGRIVPSMMEDALVIGETFGEPTGFMITKDFIITPDNPGYQLKFSEIEHDVFPAHLGGGVSVDLTAASASIYRDNRDRELYICSWRPETENHPMSLERLREYAFDSSNPNEPRVRVWHTHNLGGMGNGMDHYLRNFAILFNNLGLAEL